MTRQQVGEAKMNKVEEKLREAGYGEQVDTNDIFLNWSGEIVLSGSMQSKAAATELAKISGARVEGWTGHYGLTVHIKFPKMARRYRYI